MPCMPHFHDHFIPSPDIVLRKKDDTPAAAAPTGPQPCCQQAGANLQKRFDKIMDTVFRPCCRFVRPTRLFATHSSPWLPRNNRPISGRFPSLTLPDHGRTTANDSVSPRSAGYV